MGWIPAKERLKHGMIDKEKKIRTSGVRHEMRGRRGKRINSRETFIPLIGPFVAIANACHYEYRYKAWDEKRERRTGRRVGCWR